MNHTTITGPNLAGQNTKVKKKNQIKFGKRDFKHRK